MPEAATGGVLQKKSVLYNVAKLTANSCDRENTCEFCKLFKKTFFAEQTASEMHTL